jgi:plastocyanin
MRLTNPRAWLNTTPRRLLATLFALLLVGVVAQLTITTASGKLSATAVNSSTYAASSCFLPVAVAVTSNNFTPQSLTVKAGCQVKWTQAGSGNHTTTNTTPSLGSLWDRDPIGSGGTFTYTFASTGTFPYKCRNHGGAGMTGTITVN